MKRGAWLNRLVQQLPGWHVWYSSFGTWSAVPAAEDVDHTTARTLAGRVTTRSPQALRTLCRQRYGWNDCCESCGVLARECGHRMPETKVNS